MKTITALEISKQLPMRVKSLNKVGMFKETTIRFHKVGENNTLIGNVVGDNGRTIGVIDPTKEFKLLHQGGE